MSESGVTLSSLTTMRVGGPVNNLLVADTREELVMHTMNLWGEGDDWLLLGGGSNTIVSDEGYPGTVLLVRHEGISEVPDADIPADRVRVRVQAGHDWDTVVVTTLARNWGGLETLSGIPGLAGAAPIQNIGAYGTELGDVLHSIELLDRDEGEIRRVFPEELALAYRDSALKRLDLEGVVVSIDLLLRRGAEGEEVSSAPIRYAQLASELDTSMGAVVPAKLVREAVLALRTSKAMVLDVTDHDTWSSGSFFTNPIVSEHTAKLLPADAPRYPLHPSEEEPVLVPLDEVGDVGSYVRRPPEDRRVKLSAAWLIEHAGIRRGFALPGSGAALSSKHTLAITNRGAATAADVAELARYIRARVQSEFGVLLIPEPNLYGLEV